VSSPAPGSFGVNPFLPVPERLRLGLGMLVVGTGLLGYQTAAMAEMERDRSPNAEPAGGRPSKTD
jgi:hypothetical protein